MNINKICYVCVSDKGVDIESQWLCLDENQRPFIATMATGYLPILFGSQDDALDALLKYTNFKGWHIEKLWIANNI